MVEEKTRELRFLVHLSDIAADFEILLVLN